MIRQTIVIGLPSIFSHRSHTCKVELSQLFASYFGSFKQSQKVQPRCCFLYDMVVWLCSPLKIASLMMYLSLRAHMLTSTPLMRLQRLMTLICSLPLSKVQFWHIPSPSLAKFMQRRILGTFLAYFKVKAKGDKKGDNANKQEARQSSLAWLVCGRSLPLERGDAVVSLFSRSVGICLLWCVKHNSVWRGLSNLKVAYAKTRRE